MRLGRTKQSLRAGLETRQGRSLFEDARARHPALAEHASVAEVLAVLADGSQRRYREKDAIAQAIVEEQQARPDPFWSAVLVVAFTPMLRHLCGRVIGEVLADAELDQLVLASFLESVDRFPLDQRSDRICMRLRQATQRRVFRRVRLEQREQRNVVACEPDELVRLERELVEQRLERKWPEPRPIPRRGLDPVDWSDAVRFLVQHAGHALTDEQLELMIATFVVGERLPEYVRRRNPDLRPDEFRRIYQRIKRRHSRTLALLRETLAPLRDVPADDAGDETGDLWS